MWSGDETTTCYTVSVHGHQKGGGGGHQILQHAPAPIHGCSYPLCTPIIVMITGIQISEGLLQSVTERWGLAPKPARVE